MSQKISVLVTGIGGLVARQIALSLLLDDRFEVVGCDSNPLNAFIYEDSGVRSIHIVPPVSSPDYLDALSGICELENIDFLAPTGETEIAVLASERSSLAPSSSIPHADYVSLFGSKWRTNQALADVAGDPLVPRTVQIETEEDINNAIAQFGVPIWIRASVGQAAETAFPAHDFEGGRAWMTLRNGYGSYIASEYLPGRNLAWTALYDNGELLCSTLHERVQYFNTMAAPSGVTGVASVSRTVHDDGPGPMGNRAVRHIQDLVGLPLNGIITADMKEDRNGMARITEINPRPTNTLHLAEAGCNFATHLVDISMARSITAPQYNACKPDIYYLRDIDCRPTIIPGDQLRTAR
jgi:predicted ATP-grasp superfamily ATP-dependent carboligase